MAIKTGIVSMSQLVKSDNWTPEFSLSNAFQELKEKSPRDIIAAAQEKLDGVDEYLVEKIKDSLTTKQGSDSQHEMNLDRAVTAGTKNKVLGAIESRKISESGPIGVQVAVCVYSLVVAAENSQSFSELAVKERELLLKELQKIDSFLENKKEPVIASVLDDSASSQDVSSLPTP